MIRFMVAAPASGSGKTVMTCALLAALERRGLSPCAFKCGPDYIDPMFHRAVLGVESHNLDLFLSDAETVRRLFSRGSAGHGAAVCEGVMGFYDGVGCSDRASAWHIANTLEIPVILAVRPKGTSLTLAAQIRGLCAFRKPSRIAGILLNDCAPALCRTLAPMLERETGLPVLGSLPRLEQAAFQSRHLGLQTAEEIADLKERIQILSETLEAHSDIDRLLELCAGTDETPVFSALQKSPGVPIAVARDEAFCFIYTETLEALRTAGGEPVFFSPLRDGRLPDNACGLCLPGGYPKLYAAALSQNGAMLQAIAAAVKDGLPTVAECGGFLYLGRTLEDIEGHVWPMAGVLPGAGYRVKRLVRFGYTHLRAEEDSLLFRAGEKILAHEFHYWDSTENGHALRAEKAASGQTWDCGFAGPTLYAAFPHLYLAGRPEMALRFTEAARNYGKRREGKNEPSRTDI